ncbi:MAG TPA: hypothetical protein VEH52_01170 [Gaiellaceae bacterium]|nr:hypothetical protein [Gaiellaceae bacterium]
MPAGFGPRFLIEAGFLIAVAVVAGIERFRTVTIVLMMAAAWLVVAMVEWFMSRRNRATPAVAETTQAEVVAQPVAPVEPEPSAEPEPVAEAVPVEPDPEPESHAEPEPEPEEKPQPPVERPKLVGVAPPPDPEPEPEPVVPSPLEPRVVSLAARSSAPQEWNLWDLERLAREQSGDDAVRDEERAFLLMYLREFASADGVLPADFDSVVRESFGDALEAVHS